MEVGRAHPQDKQKIREIANKAKEAPKDAKAADAKPTNGHAGKGVDKKQVKRILPVKLTKLELGDLALKVGQAFAKVCDAENDLAAASKKAKEKIKSLKADHAGIVGVINSGEQQREVLCEEVYDWEKKLVTVRRLDVPEDDAGAIVAKRGMSEDERQYPLPFAGDKKGAEKKTDGAAEPAKPEKPAEKRYHQKGDLCRQDSCRRRHPKPSLLKRAGIELEDEAAPAPKASAAPEPPDPPQPGTKGPKELPTGDWRTQAPANYRGRHEDDSNCFEPACVSVHSTNIPPKAAASAKMGPVH